jgi:hypothetical protein
MTNLAKRKERKGRCEHQATPAWPREGGRDGGNYGWLVGWLQSPTLGVHTHAHGHPYPWVLGGHGCDVIIHGWASVLCILASSSKSRSKFSDAGNTLTNKCSGLKLVTMNNLLFVRSNQDLMYAGNIHYTIFEYMGAISIAWVDMGGHMSCYGWAWVGIGHCWWLWSGYGYKFEGKCWALVGWFGVAATWRMVAGLSPVLRERERQRVQKARKAPFPVQLLLLHTFARAWAPTPSPPGPSQVTPQKILRPDQLLSFGATREPPLSTRLDPTQPRGS